MIAFLELGATGSMAFTVTSAEVLSHEGSETVGKVAAVDLLRSMIERMTTQVLGARVAFPTAFEGAFEFTIGEDFATASPSLRGLTVDLHFSCHGTEWNVTRDAEDNDLNTWEMSEGN